MNTDRPTSRTPEEEAECLLFVLFEALQMRTDCGRQTAANSQRGLPRRPCSLPESGSGAGGQDPTKGDTTMNGKTDQHVIEVKC